MSRALCSDSEICDTISSNTLRKLRLRVDVVTGSLQLVRMPAPLFTLPIPNSLQILPGQWWHSGGGTQDFMSHQGTPEPQHRMEGLMAETKCSLNKGYYFSADRTSLHPQTQALTARRQNLRPSHLLLPGHTHVPGPFHPEDTVLSHIWVPTGRSCPRTCSSPQKDLPVLLAEVDWPLV